MITIKRQNEDKMIGLASVAIAGITLSTVSMGVDSPLQWDSMDLIS